ncbi:hypothetical protein IXZ18_11070 (plasmid) [Campylobacter fetus subsp. venerealis bv. intermedius]|uniref:hypothetical protein n=1 Tax=Campylobacter fetus TaxID=196 RepID=UPI0003D8074E|nr:hypothetical protein [Campylobacter fetus]AHE95258.1 hypothetical protein CFVI03293_B0009 [Campylobacter fetus subsp. venerealis cfvi03/293]OCS23631.1 hypothetical protein CFVI9825_08195 [Campylobacter fetus subsp. venerealis cfvi9825]WKW28112.1 hypothetical protein IXZ24_10920 [Campylobacter fetus subsp. venerealis bv. intermedius]WKW30238.1 hypothetical protein IXZ18_11070 [Campylobacter fetus subsp. venerealis bv. intermedius]
MQSVSELKSELYSIHNTEKHLREIYSDARVIDLKDVGDMLVKVQRQIEDMSKSKSLFGRITDKLPIIGNLKRSAEKEIALQQELTEYITNTLVHFEKKYDELIEHLKLFEQTRDGFSSDILKLDEWVEKATKFYDTLTDTADKLAMDRLLTEAKSEIKRKHDSLKSLIEPIILSATHLTQNINEILPILRNILYTELKTMVGVNSFKNAANMMITLKESIVEIQKLNVINTNEAIVEILNNTKTNLLTNKDIAEMDRLRAEGKKQIERVAMEIKKAQIENSKFMNEKYLELKNSGALQLENISKKDEILIEAKEL